MGADQGVAVTVSAARGPGGRGDGGRLPPLQRLMLIFHLELLSLDEFPSVITLPLRFLIWRKPFSAKISPLRPSWPRRDNRAAPA
jgi:hypothetical protein